MQRPMSFYLHLLFEIFFIVFEPKKFEMTLQHIVAYVEPELLRDPYFFQDPQLRNFKK